MQSKGIKFLSVLDSDCREPANRAAMVMALRGLGYRVNVLHRPVPIEMVRDEVSIMVALIDETLKPADAGPGAWRLLAEDDHSVPSDTLLFGDLRFAITTRDGVDIKVAAEEIAVAAYHAVTMVPKLYTKYERATILPTAN